jgi:hypothetical protein
MLRQLVSVIATFLMLGTALVGQTQSSVDVLMVTNGTNDPTGFTAAPPADAPTTPPTTIEITKIEEQNSNGTWTDVTSGFSRSNNPSALVTVKHLHPELVLAGRVLRIHYKTNNTITSNPVITQVYN